jgi:hypothetical protein
MLSVTTRIAIIYDGWKNYIFPSKEVEEIAKERAEICASCDYMKEITRNWGAGSLQYVGCSLCGCPISKKVRSMNSKNCCSLNPPKW